MGEIQRGRESISRAQSTPGLLSALTLKRPDQFCSVDQGIYGRLTLRSLAVLAESAATGLRHGGSGVLGVRGSSGPGRPGWLPTQVSGKEVTSPPPPPLRTARESFPSCSSSLSNALRRTRLSHI